MRWAERCFAVVGVLFVFYSLTFNVAPIISPSMSPTLNGTSLEDADWVLMENGRTGFEIRDAGNWWHFEIQMETG